MVFQTVISKICKWSLLHSKVSFLLAKSNNLINTSVVKYNFILLKKCARQVFLTLLLLCMNNLGSDISRFVNTLKFSELPDDVKSAFSGIHGNKVRLQKGTSLFRFSDHPYASPWWSETSQLMDLLLTARAKGIPLYNHVRSSTAILRSFNPGFFNLLVVELTQDLQAFRGRVAPQNEASKYMDNRYSKHYKQRYTKPVFFGGGNGQVYIPRFHRQLLEKHIDMKVPRINLMDYAKWEVEAGTINIYDKIDDILKTLMRSDII